MTPFDPDLDLVLERIVDVPKHLLWQGWTVPAVLMQWFTPAPWKTVACEIELRPGGVFHTVMRGPDGPEMFNTGCILEVVEQERLVWTGALLPGFRPRPATEPTPPFVMSAAIMLESIGTSTKYTARAIHGDAQSRRKHEQMGFHTGWGKALDQLVVLAKTM